MISTPTWLMTCKRCNGYVVPGIMLGLSLFVVGCSSVRSTGPAIMVSQRGNEIVLTLPAGTNLFFKEEKTAIQFQALFFNEAVRKANMVTIKSDLVIVTPAYLAGRDSAEMELLKEIEQLKVLGK
jgi:hypothetical protein